MDHPSADRPDERIAASSALDAEGFAARLRRDYRRLWTIAAAVTGDRVTADDIVQDAALIALGKLGQYQPGTNFFAWMAKIVRFSALNDVRKRRHRGLVIVEPATLDQSAAGQSRRADMARPGSNGAAADYNADFDDEVTHALDALGPTARACLLLRTLHQLSYAEISAALDIPEGTAMSHVHRAKMSLRERLRSNDANRANQGGRA